MSSIIYGRLGKIGETMSNKFKVGQVVWSLRRSPFSNKPRHIRKGKVVKAEHGENKQTYIWCKFEKGEPAECYEEDEIDVNLFSSYETAEIYMNR